MRRGRGRCGIPTDGGASRSIGKCGRQLLIVVGQRGGDNGVPAGLAESWTGFLRLLLLMVALMMTDYRGGCQRGIVQVEHRKVRGITGIFGLTSADREMGISGQYQDNSLLSREEPLAFCPCQKRLVMLRRWEGIF